MPDEKREKLLLIERIIASDEFVPAPKQQGLLRFLFQNADSYLMAWEIEERYFDRPKELRYHNEAHAREAIAKLQDRLEAYAESAPDDRWICKLPPSTREKGYRLIVRRKIVKQTPSERFWRAHLDDPKRIMVICNSHLFFRDESSAQIFRFADVNA
jgi:hypothetical protein